MGASSSSSLEAFDSAARSVVRAHARSTNIDRVLRASAQETTVVIRIVVLGRKASGKTTFTRQARTLFSAATKGGAPGAFSEDEVAGARALMQSVALTTMQSLLRIANEHGFRVEDAAAEEAVRHAPVKGGVPPGLVPAINSLWREEPAIERAWELRGSTVNDIPANAAYFVQRVGAAASASFKPDSTDLIKLYFPTHGIIETRTSLPAGRIFRAVNFYDVGSTGMTGSASRYRRISELFLDARAVLYCVSLADYDVTTTVDGELVNKLAEAIKEYERLLSSSSWERCMIILLFTHRDL